MQYRSILTALLTAGALATTPAVFAQAQGGGQGAEQGQGAQGQGQGAQGQGQGAQGQGQGAQGQGQGAQGQGQGAQGAQGAQGQGGEGKEIDVDDEMLDNFSDAYVEVRDIQSDFADKLGSVEDREKAQEMQREAQEKMVSAVEDSDLSVQEYNQVASQMQNDPDLREKVMERTEDEDEE
ncbi:MAG: DUF4168 domain-containing protein [Thiohalospira sp.]